MTFNSVPPSRFPEAASAMQEQLVQFEEIQRDWEMEKEALEQVVISVRGQLKQKEQALLNLKQSQVGFKVQLTEVWKS